MIERPEAPAVLCAVCEQVVDGMMGALGRYKPVEHGDRSGAFCVGFYQQHGHQAQEIAQRDGDEQPGTEGPWMCVCGDVHAGDRGEADRSHCPRCGMEPPEGCDCGQCAVNVSSLGLVYPTVLFPDPEYWPEGAVCVRTFLGRGRGDAGGAWWVGGTDAESDEVRRPV